MLLAARNSSCSKFIHELRNCGQYTCFRDGDDERGEDGGGDCDDRDGGDYGDGDDDDDECE